MQAYFAALLQVTVEKRDRIAVQTVARRESEVWHDKRQVRAESALVEMKFVSSAKPLGLIETARYKKNFFLKRMTDNILKRKKTHYYFYQVQGARNITGCQFCYFVHLYLRLKVSIHKCRDSFRGAAASRYNGAFWRWPLFFVDFWKQVKEKCSGFLWGSVGGQVLQLVICFKYGIMFVYDYCVEPLSAGNMMMTLLFRTSLIAFRSASVMHWSETISTNEMNCLLFITNRRPNDNHSPPVQQAVGVVTEAVPDSSFETPLQTANRSAAEKRSSSKLLMKTVTLKRATTDLFKACRLGDYSFHRLLVLEEVFPELGILVLRRSLPTYRDHQPVRSASPYPLCFWCRFGLAEAVGGFTPGLDHNVTFSTSTRFDRRVLFLIPHAILLLQREQAAALYWRPTTPDYELTLGNTYPVFVVYLRGQETTHGLDHLHTSTPETRIHSSVAWSETATSKGQTLPIIENGTAKMQNSTHSTRLRALPESNQAGTVHCSAPVIRKVSKFTLVEPGQQDPDPSYLAGSRTAYRSDFGESRKHHMAFNNLATMSDTDIDQQEHADISMVEAVKHSCHKPNCRRMGTHRIKCAHCQQSFHCVCLGWADEATFTDGLECRCDQCRTRQTNLRTVHMRTHLCSRLNVRSSFMPMKFLKSCFATQFTGEDVPAHLTAEFYSRTQTPDEEAEIFVCVQRPTCRLNFIEIQHIDVNRITQHVTDCYRLNWPCNDGSGHSCLAAARQHNLVATDRQLPSPDYLGTSDNSKPLHQSPTGARLQKSVVKLASTSSRGGYSVFAHELGGEAATKLFALSDKFTIFFPPLEEFTLEISLRPAYHYLGLDVPQTRGFEVPCASGGDGINGWPWVAWTVLCGSLTYFGVVN
ncbi:hypothetical protein PR048_014888 [Dryococelus australis]|uniref:Zinc finger PHD-type domain-containing protein n=1 Tax=Dryococelus australis TaxID=614101 RepID=A0ABQ9HFE6_9NEOP|nr:hypothetical protein PR048_014888 [Dryococelus australis]